ncbi:MAG: nitrilase-related carbon-nitrogen hydrolase, partial [Kiloniellales bacterium]|nr:nitrilase-related carbon-nitrogen hydrolase [Kiloniellales bacterium]
MKIALFQGEGLSRAPSEVIEIMRQAASEAADDGADLVVFPELFLTGYNLGDDAREFAEHKNSKNNKRIVDIAQNYAISIVYGFIEEDSGKYYNTARFISKSGSTLLNHRKCALFGPYEQEVFDRGNTIDLVSFGDFTIGLLICYEIEFPEYARTLAQKGADLIVAISATSGGYSYVSETLVPARAIENQIFVAFANRCGRESDLAYS